METSNISNRAEAVVTEAELQVQVFELAALYGWKTCHFRAARTAHGWRTPVSGDGAGWPDVVLVGHGRVIFAEMKSATGKLSPEQEVWRDALVSVGADWRLWRPSDLDEIAATLSDGRARKASA